MKEMIGFLITGGVIIGGKRAESHGGPGSINGEYNIRKRWNILLFNSNDG